MILTDEELLTAICGHIPVQNIDNVVVKDIIKDGRAIESAVAAAVAKRCADLCASTGPIAADMYGDGAECISTADLCADAIKQEFGEVSNG